VLLLAINKPAGLFLRASPGLQRPCSARRYNGLVVALLSACTRRIVAIFASMSCC